MTLAGELCEKTLNQIVERFGLEEVVSLPAGNAPAEAEMRVLRGGPVHKLVTVFLAFPPAGLDSHMVFAFTAPDSPVPHFTLDSVVAGPHHAFHLDLIPRLDLNPNLGYIDAAYTALTATFEQARDLEGLSRAHLSPRQLAMMSPWMLAARATEDAFAAVTPLVDVYLAHWMDLCESGVPDGALAGADLGGMAERDRRHRAALFNPDVDPVWDQVAQVLGADMSERFRRELLEQEVVG